MKVTVRAFLFALLIVSFSAEAQLKKYKEFEELADPRARDIESWNLYKTGAYSGFVSEDVHFDRSSAPATEQVLPNWKAKGWKGERVHTQALIWTTKALKDVKLSVGDLVGSGSSRISKVHVNANFIRYVLTDHLGDLKKGCGIPAGLDTSLRADMIDNISSFTIDPQTSRPLWLSIDIPQGTKPGIYKGNLKILSAGYNAQLPFQIEVLNHELPLATNWKFHFDMWQNPYSVARVNGVEPWSDAHFEIMRPVMKRLADAGQKVITATIIKDPWNSQTYDIYGSMINWTKKKDGSWEYDYTVFDKWVQYMMDLGVDKFINCYSMIPWNLKFHYFDESTNKEEVLVAKPGTQEYTDHWQNMLTDFANHLKKKGWFGITTIAMDERPEKDMKAAIAIIKAADPNFKVSLAGNYHNDLKDELVDYSVAFEQPIPEEVIKSRREKGMTTTFYTCCTEPYPNIHTSAPYAEATWLPWYALNKGFDGYLFWSYNSWNEDPLHDARFRQWVAGDTYKVYPGNRSSIRFERLREGIQDFEKVNILREQFKKTGNTAGLQKLEDAIKAFELSILEEHTAANAVRNAKKILNSF